MEQPIYHLEKVVRTRSESEAEDFNGPLDLILHLLSKNRMEIRDIQISLILDQYLAWMARRRELDLEVASEFVAMASQLMFIKTRMLLSIRDEEALSEMEQLIASLEEHQRSESRARVRAVLPLLERQYAVGRDFLVKTPEPLPARSYEYEHTAEELRRAVQEVLSRTGRRLPPPMAAFEGIVGREPYPVADKAAEVLQRLLRFGAMGFQALFRGSRSRSEIVATFLALLELCKDRRVRLGEGEDACIVTALDVPAPEGEREENG